MAANLAELADSAHASHNRVVQLEARIEPAYYITQITRHSS